MELLADRRAEVEAHLRRLGWIGEREPLLALERPGEGNMNRTLRACLPERTLILKQAVPYVAKYPQIPAPVARLEAEAAFYRAIAGADVLCRYTPAVLGADPAHHLLCLEDLGNAGDLTCLYAEGPQPRFEDALGSLARWLGALHALPVPPDAVPANEDMRRLNHAHLFEVPFDPDNGVALSPALRDRQRALADDPALRQEVAELGALYLGARRHVSRPALLHGDYYPGSWLAHPARGALVIDPEFGFVGPPEFDVGVFTAHLIMAGFGDDDIAGALTHYTIPQHFSHDLAGAFAGVEMIRRLLGVAQLPLPADDAQRLRWLERARHAVLG